MRNKTKLVYGVGINDLDEPVNVSGSWMSVYWVWKGMLQRCYYEKALIKRPSYRGCSVCDEWKYLSKFKQWFDANYIEGFHLDKDILVEDNKVYSPETCRFIPPRLNTLLLDRCSARGDLPLGISALKPSSKTRRQTISYCAYCQDSEGIQLSKTFKTIEEAQSWYSATKTRVVKEQAIRAFLANEIKSDVYLALVRRKF